ncbi:MAG: J domain-containing protein [Succinivibrionaceae bacterium]|nr:J domain-containing protein [Succinivibrionaceae bacterium]
MTEQNRQQCGTSAARYRPGAAGDTEGEDIVAVTLRRYAPAMLFFGIEAIALAVVVPIKVTGKVAPDLLPHSILSSAVFLLLAARLVFQRFPAPATRYAAGALGFVLTIAYFVIFDFILRNRSENLEIFFYAALGSQIVLHLTLAQLVMVLSRLRMFAHRPDVLGAERHDGFRPQSARTARPENRERSTFSHGRVRPEVSTYRNYATASSVVATGNDAAVAFLHLAGSVLAASSSDRSLKIIFMDELLENLRIYGDARDRVLTEISAGAAMSVPQVRLEMSDARVPADAAGTFFYIAASALFYDENITRRESDLFLQLADACGLDHDTASAIVIVLAEEHGLYLDETAGVWKSVSERKYDDLHADRRQEASQEDGITRQDLINAYHILQIPATAGAEELKMQYRRMISRYHPDRAASLKLGEAARAEYQKITQEINEAWDLIRKARGL